MKKVLYIIDCLYENVGGGSEKQFLKLYNHLDDIDIDPYIIFLKDQPVHAKFEWQNMPYTIGFTNFLSPFLLLKIWKILRYIKQNEITTIHSLFDDSTIIASIIKLTRPDLTLIVSQRNTGHTRIWLRRKMISIACKISDYVAVNSMMITKFLVEDYGVEKSKIVVIDNAFEYNVQTNCDEVIGVINKIRQQYDYVGVTVANLRAVKGIDDLINAISILDKNIKIAIIIIGDGGGYEKYLKIVAEKKLEGKIYIMGYRNDIHCFLNNVDFSILPSRSEGASNSLIEYVFYELPIVATRVGGSAELLGDGKYGILVNPCNERELAAAIEKICKNLEEYKELSLQLKDIAADKYSLESVISKYKALYWNSEK